MMDNNKLIEQQKNNMEKENKKLMLKIKEEFEQKTREQWNRMVEKAELERGASWDKLAKENEINNDKWMDEIKTRFINFFDLMIKLGWPPHTDMNMMEAKKIVELNPQYGVENLENMINKYFLNKYDSKEINKMLEIWRKNKLLDKRMPILEQAIFAHLHGKFFLSVCIIISQLEGIIALFENHDGRMNGKDIERYLKKEIPSNEAHDFGYAYKQFFKNILYAEFRHGMPIDSPISRHAILHGADVEYGTEVNSLKAILTFDNLLHFLTEN